MSAVHGQGYTTPTPVQKSAIPSILAGRDLMATAQTGTGKTAGFALPLLQRLMQAAPRSPRGVRALILVPTRELAVQVADSVRAYGTRLPLRSAVIYGGVGMQPQVNALRGGVDIVVATPGRLLDHVARHTIELSRVEILVLDEADRMLDMGFVRDIQRVLARLPARRQNLLFCATFADEIKSLADRLLNHPELIEVSHRNKPADTVEQIIYRVDRERKSDLLVELIHRGGWSQVLVFTRTKHGANRLAQKLAKSGIHTDAIHGNKSQTARMRALAGFKAGKIRTLVATEVAARGLDIAGLPHVVNFELPFVPEDYIHRIGRTGRAGASGHAVSLVCIDEQRLLRDIERLLGRKLHKQVFQGFEPDPTICAVPLTKSGGPRQGERKACGAVPFGEQRSHRSRGTSGKRRGRA